MSVLVPQSRIIWAPPISSVSVPRLWPTVICMPTVPAIEQMVRSSSDAPNVWKKRRSIEPPWMKPMVPA